MNVRYEVSEHGYGVIHNIAEVIRRGCKCLIEPDGDGVAFRLFYPDGRQYAIRCDNEPALIERVIGRGLASSLGPQLSDRNDTGVRYSVCVSQDA
jgi:hypothetical protein